MNLTNKNECVLVRRNFDRLIMKVFTNHLVVYIIEVAKIILNLFIFFLRKDFKRIKSTKLKTSNFYPLRSLCGQKIVALVAFLFAYFCFISRFFVCVFIRARSFRKKNKEAQNYLCNLNYIYYYRTKFLK